MNSKKFVSWIPNGIPCLIIITLLFCYLGHEMGAANMLNTIMKTAHDLLLNTVIYLMGICVITGALGKIFVEFGVVSLLEKILRPLMKPLFNLPGVASLGAVLTFLSDNPAIISLAQDKKFSAYFKKFQFISKKRGRNFNKFLLFGCPLTTGSRKKPDSFKNIRFSLGIFAENNINLITGTKL